jgi:hypothetical protein
LYIVWKWERETTLYERRAEEEQERIEETKVSRKFNRERRCNYGRWNSRVVL